MRTRFPLLVSLVVACSGAGNDAEPLRRADGSLFSSAGGEVSLQDGSRLRFMITSERYKQWEAARAGLSRPVVARFGALLQPKAPTQRSIERATAYLESEPRARQAIERTGMSVSDFVLMTVALEQEMQLASSRGTPPSAVVPPPEFVPPPESVPPFDSVRPESVPPPEAPPLVAPRPDTAHTVPAHRLPDSAAPAPRVYDSTMPADTMGRRAPRRPPPPVPARDSLGG